MSTIPLLTLNPQTSRKDYLDNLRCALTALLVLHHAALETAVTSRKYSTAVAMFVATQKMFLWSAFFLVSGYGASLSTHAARGTTTLKNYISKSIKVTLPALLYAVIGQWGLFTLLSTRWPDIFGIGTRAYAKFSGPVPYVLLLLVFDSSAFLIRQLKLPPWMYPSFSPNHITLLGFIVLTGYTFLNAAFISPLFSIPSFLSFLVYDIPDVCFPISHIIAYWAGWQFKTLKRSILAPSSRSAVARLAMSSIMSFTSLYYAQRHWKPLAQLLHLQLSDYEQKKVIFIDGGLNGHTIAFALWSSFTYFSISASLISTFFHLSWTASKWGWFGRNTYIQTYVHIIPILLVKYHLRVVENGLVRYTLVGLVGLTGTWFLAALVYGGIGIIQKVVQSVQRIKRLLR